MKIKGLIYTLFLCMLFACYACDNKRKEHSDTLLDAVSWVQNSGEYKALTIQAFNLGKSRLDKIMENDTVPTKPKAIILDIDETVLDNSPFFANLIIKNEKLDQQTWEGWENWTDQIQATALPGAVPFLKYADSQGVAIFYVTNRDQTEEEATFLNLKNESFPNVHKENLLLKNQSSSSKIDRFNKVQKEYNVVLYFGDNLSDFSDRYYHEDLDKTVDEKVLEDSDYFGSKYIVLPNPMYGDWETSLYEKETSDKRSEKQIKLDKLRGF